MYGQINNMWVYSDENTTRHANALWAQLLTKVVFTGEHLGKGMVGSMKLIKATPSAVASNAKTAT